MVPQRLFFEGQTWLSSVKGLYLGFLINAQDQSMIGRVHVQAHHILNLLYKMFVITQLEGPRQMGLEFMGFPDPVDQRMVNSELFGQSTRAPMSGTSRFFLGGFLNDRLDQLFALLWSSSATGSIPDNALCPLLVITPSPQADCSLVYRKPIGDLLVAKSACSQEHNLSLLLQACFCAPPLGPLGQDLSFTIAQINRTGNCHGFHVDGGLF
jgi:hypothetical protein